MKQLYRFSALGVFLVLLLSACGGSSSSDASHKVNVIENEFTIISSLTTFSPGVTYHFEITNNGKTAHEFMIMPKSEGTMSGMGMGDMDKIALAKVENIGPGQTAALDYSFSPSMIGTQPEFSCYYPGHYESGMKQTVTIKS